MYYRFRVLNGDHVEGGKTYGPGSLIDTHRDLGKAFKNKFELVAVASDPGMMATPSPAIPPAGNASPPAPVAPVSPPPPPPPVETVPEPPSKPAAKSPGMDVSEDFPQALSRGLVVWQKGAKFTVTRGGVPVQEKPMTQTQLLAYLSTP